MLNKLLFLIVSVFMFTGCSKTPESPLVVSTDVWIGATPLYYAHAMGWLEDANIQMIQVDSIDKNLEMYDMKASDVFTGTEHEYKRAKMKHSDLLVPIIYDRSFGGDVVLANRSIEELRESDDKIDAYVELDTVGQDMLEYFLVNNHIAKERLVIYDRHQPEIVQVRTTAHTPATIIITYNPQDLMLKQYGFKEVASSKNNDYLVIDMFITSSQIYKNHTQQFRTLKEDLKKSVEAYRKDPKEFYAKVKPYLGNPTYDEFENMRKNIQWINNEISEDLLKRMKKAKLPTDHLVQ